MGVTVDLEVVTPEKLILSETVQLVTVPGSEGYFGVLSGHVPMISSLRSGVVRMGQGDDAVHLAVSKGFAEVRPDRVTLLVDRAVFGKKVDAAAVTKIRDAAQDELDGTPTESEEYETLRDKLDFANAQLAALEGELV
ncbi:ATP synthase F1 subcomplex epsilon subunit [Magnetococcus marinus MC-1]|uniref:ATP synthase epsilon chain n=1 Tax=Magnetococcus marinus (strain ATCC BAA-1437 / JCM 17883 / MC-1) TaxID=156889 RepID=ATPE_MAGMM|nr:ATP synthase F1 subunit epsilon [Magnetococcus marinus]A0LD99.1 RecName: Full=ATP synthase epsilon chain; AltName: Full=ATP synthase F1 sector epsilon subunit; AltName: Full=F-ATPase epsilon subunit [Magnetococcus marinus MC-1]ABK45942.1 ATP synthase F1 subcomplex epsilon subunit [Magnetococcus marinus MC-1]